MKLTFTKSQFEIPDGKYLAKFMGVTLKDATGQLDQRGHPLPPGMTWDFQIVEGEQSGKKADRLTGRTPTPKSGCGKFLAAVSDTVLKDGQEVDLQQFVGQLYRITIQDNRVSDNPPPARVYGAGNQTTEESRSAPPRSGPPPRKTEQQEAKFYVDTGEDTDPPLLPLARIKELVAEKGRVAFDWKACPDGGSEWKLLADAIPDSANWSPF